MATPGKTTAAQRGKQASVEPNGRPRIPSAATKPNKPYPEYPLYAHGNGQWAKKIAGARRYFGSWIDDPSGEEALKTYLKEVHYWQAGQAPPAEQETLANLLNAFMGDKQSQCEAGDIASSTCKEYQDTCDVIAAALNKCRPVESLTQDDFLALRQALGRGKRATAYSPVTVKRRLTIARMVFAMAAERGHSLPYRKALKAPSKLVIRQRQRERGKRLYAAAEVRKLVKAAKGDLKAMILMGINCGFGPKDCATLPADAVSGEWHDYWRPKTQAERRCWLWPETREALPIHGEWDRWKVARAFTHLAKEAKVRNLGHYSLRRTFETVATTADVSQAVIDHIMGHLRADMASVYRQAVFDQQIKKCAQHVRAWYVGKVELT